MDKKTTIISGANGNLGSAIVQKFIDDNQKVIGFVHRKTDEETETPNDYHEFEVDLINDNETSQAVSITINRFTNIDFAVLTAGGFTSGSIASTAAVDLENYFRLNFETAYNIVKPLLGHMQQNKKGKIFFIGSGTGLDTRKAKNTVAYSLSKSLLFQLANIINSEMNETNIQAHVIVPGTIDTPQNRKAMPDADFTKWQNPNDIAEVILKYTKQENDIDKTVIVIEDELKS